MASALPIVHFHFISCLTERDANNAQEGRRQHHHWEGLQRSSFPRYHYAVRTSVNLFCIMLALANIFGISS